MNAMRPRNSVFDQVGGLHPRYSVFDLSYVKTMTADMGILYPVMCDEVVPGDIFKIGNQMVLRFQPMLAPILHEINAYVHYFFVPYRLLWDSWEDFITGGPDGNLTPSLPTWIGDDQTATVGSLWDYFGFQTIPASSGLHTTLLRLLSCSLNVRIILYGMNTTETRPCKPRSALIVMLYSFELGKRLFHILATLAAARTGSRASYFWHCECCVGS